MFLKGWLPVFLWAGLIFYLSSVPNLESGFEADFFLRKAAHIFEYAVLAILLFNAFSRSFEKKQKQPSFKTVVFYVFLISFLYAVSDEFHQTFVFGRSGNIKDVLIDSVGIILGIIVFLVSVKSKNRHFK